MMMMMMGMERLTGSLANSETDVGEGESRIRTVPSTTRKALTPSTLEDTCVLNQPIDSTGGRSRAQRWRFKLKEKERGRLSPQRDGQRQGDPDEPGAAVPREPEMFSRFPRFSFSSLYRARCRARRRAARAPAPAPAPARRSNVHRTYGVQPPSSVQVQAGIAILVVPESLKAEYGTWNGERTPYTGRQGGGRGLTTITSSSSKPRGGCGWWVVGGERTDAPRARRSSAFFFRRPCPLRRKSPSKLLSPARPVLPRPALPRPVPISIFLPHQHSPAPTPPLQPQPKRRPRPSNPAYPHKPQGRTSAVAR
ncbi:hypothetical protein GALMADRAFT_414221 [Galerina marginata CBS 339.88]|uniref:Uncharacterized protein n=1 Tax=Galerina marginata (strain CBS 339.88) TaxID=685588 RepID=A0A067T3R3_GALM3|nr:hypothetical protein GALMADRAFT_414221 [Galerina marginata CBS 339.88]